MEDKPLTESINKQYSKYGSLRQKESEPKIELCNGEDPMKFLTRIDSSIKDAKAKVKNSIDKSNVINQDQANDYETSYDISEEALESNTIPMIKLEKVGPK